MKNKYRVVTDSYNGYEAQIKYWFFPFFWFQMHNNINGKKLSVNSFRDIEDAIVFIEMKKQKNKRTVVFKID